MLTVKAVGSGAKHHSGGYLSAKADSELTFEAKAAAVFVIQQNSNQSARTFKIKNSSGSEIDYGDNNCQMSTTAQSFELTQGVYTIIFAGGEHKVTKMSLTYK